MSYKLLRVSFVFGLALLSAGLLSLSFVRAQVETAECDPHNLIAHQQEHAARLAAFAADLEANADQALEELYIAGIAFQALAVQCGFDRVADAQALHDVEHGLAGVQPGDHEVSAEVLARALSVGDPVKGKTLFNTLIPEVGFACAACHRAESTERLIGPGLWNVGNPEHDPSEHQMEGMDMAGAPASATPENGHSMGGMNMGSTPTPDEEHAEGMGSAETDAVEYIRTSIVDPSAYVVPGFPDMLMPHSYAEIFTEEEIDDLVAYLLTLQEG